MSSRPTAPRRPSSRRALAALLLTTSATLLSAPAQAGDWSLCPGLGAPAAEGATEPRYETFFSPYTHHWSYDEEHKQVYAVSLSRLLPNDRSCGFSVFSNSFGQPSAYVFVGKSWPGLLPSLPKLYVSATAGIIYGYVGKYKDKVPLNFGGFSPVIIPAIGYRFTPRASFEVQLLGTAAFMAGATWRF